MPTINRKITSSISSNGSSNAFYASDGAGVCGKSATKLSDDRESWPSLILQKSRQLENLENYLMFILSYREKIRSEIPTGLCSIIVDRSFYEPERNDQQQFVSKLQSAFESEPVEDCVTHPAEKMIDEALNSTNRQYVYEWISELATDLDKPVMAASLLRCLSRRAFDSGEWCVKIVQSALASDHLEMRDAAVQAAESWAGAEIRKVLEQHSENVSWLRDYIKDVINDLK